MRLNTMRDVGTQVRNRRTELGWTQADFAERLNCSRYWVVRLEQGNPRAEALRVLDALRVLGLAVETVVESAEPGPDPFAAVFEGLA